MGEAFSQQSLATHERDELGPYGLQFQNNGFRLRVMAREFDGFIKLALAFGQSLGDEIQKGLRAGFIVFQ
jgi:hypothetical protein